MNLDYTGGEGAAIDLAAACALATEQIAAGRAQEAWQLLQQLAQSAPPDATVLRLQGGLLQQSGQWAPALLLFRQALALAPGDAQAHTGAAFCLQAQGDLPAALAHFRAAVREQCRQPMHALQPPPPLHFDYRAAQDVLWRVLAQLAASGIHAFATSGTLLGLTREGRLLPFDKDLDIGLPFAQMDAASACLAAAGWTRKTVMQDLVNPLEWHGPDVALDMCGFAPDPAGGALLGGFWYRTPTHPWSRVTEFADLRLQQADGPHGRVWQLADPEAVLVPLYGDAWRVPDPDFDTVIGARNLRSCSLMTQCYAFARIYSHWVLGNLAKARAVLRHIRHHLPDDALLKEAQRCLAAESTP